MTQINYEQLNAIRPLGTSLVADAINTFQVRLQNEGFVSGHVLKCMTPEFGPMLGFAVPARIRTVHPPLREPALRKLHVVELCAKPSRTSNHRAAGFRPGARHWRVHRSNPCRGAQGPGVHWRSHQRCSP